MAASVSSIPQEQFNLFHSIDRELYTLLVMSLWRDPVESIQVIAVWIWLERIGYKNIVKKILSLPGILINELADETVLCLNCTNIINRTGFSLEKNDIPLMQSITEKEISLMFFYNNRTHATQGIMRIVDEVCVRALSDIMQTAVDRNTTQNLIDSRTIMSSFQHQSFVQPRVFEVMSGSNDSALSSTSQVNDVLPADDRTMFVTFSKGYRVREWEVREFFTRNYGDCIESLRMQDVLPTEQPLFARIVFRSATTIHVILNGMDKVKFSINGKHVWARKFVPKHRFPLPNTTLFGS